MNESDIKRLFNKNSNQSFSEERKGGQNHVSEKLKNYELAMVDYQDKKMSQKNLDKKDLSESGKSKKDFSDSGKSIDISSPSENPFSIGNTVNSSSSNNKGQSSIQRSSMAQSDSYGSISPQNVMQYKPQP